MVSSFPFPARHSPRRALFSGSRLALGTPEHNRVWGRRTWRRIRGLGRPPSPTRLASCSSEQVFAHQEIEASESSHLFRDADHLVCPPGARLIRIANRRHILANADIIRPEPRNRGPGSLQFFSSGSASSPVSRLLPGRRILPLPASVPRPRARSRSIRNEEILALPPHRPLLTPPAPPSSHLSRSHAVCLHCMS